MYDNISIGFCIYPTIHKFKSNIIDCQFAHGRQRKAPLLANEAFVSGAKYIWEYAPNIQQSPNWLRHGRNSQIEVRALPVGFNAIVSLKG